MCHTLLPTSTSLSLGDPPIFRLAAIHAYGGDSPHAKVIVLCKMRLSHCIFAFILVVGVVLTVYSAIDRWNAARHPSTAPTTTRESFDNPTEAAIRSIQLQTPTDADAVQAHKTLLNYTQHNYGKGIAIIINIAHQFYGPGLTVRKDLDPATLLANYTNPLVGI